MIGVVGAGSWGTCVAHLIAATGPVSLWARRDPLAQQINEQRQNQAYLPGVELSESVVATSDLAETLDADVVFVAVPTVGLTPAFLASLTATRAPIVVSLIKGLGPNDRGRPSQLLADAVPHADVAVLSGPNLAGELGADMPGAAVIASASSVACQVVQQLFAGTTLRVYSSTDVVGVEIAGAAKNVLAIAAGMSDGLGFGVNTKAALLTRGIAEITRLGVAMGGQPQTFVGLAGVGDVIATCMGAQSRNYRVGYQLGQGRQLQDIVGEMRQVAEGVATGPAIVRVAQQLGVEMPIATQVGSVLTGQATVASAVRALFDRDLRSE
jgi:glycerol-3-phosphate dehydrogenase (NAD(P)+)